MMTKSEIVAVTLDQLHDRFDINPESFEYVGSENEGQHKTKMCMDNIIWQTKINSSGELIEDPTNQSRTVIVTYSELERTMTVRIFNRTYPDIQSMDNQKADAYVECRKYFQKYSRNHKSFKRLKEKILRQYDHKEAKAFLKKLSNIFPNILDSHLFGK